MIARLITDVQRLITVVSEDGQGNFGGSGNIGSDPLVDPNGYHLTSVSPCIDAGDSSGNYSGQFDIDGQFRVLYSRVDMGADEYVTVY